MIKSSSSKKLLKNAKNSEASTAYNPHTKILPMSPWTSKVFGMQQGDKVSSNLAHDKYQGLLAYGT